MGEPESIASLRRRIENNNSSINAIILAVMMLALSVLALAILK